MRSEGRSLNQEWLWAVVHQMTVHPGLSDLFLQLPFGVQWRMRRTIGPPPRLNCQATVKAFTLIPSDNQWVLSAQKMSRKAVPSS